MTTLAEDLNAVRALCRFAGHAGACDDVMEAAERARRVIDVLEPLAGLSDEQLFVLASRASANARYHASSSLPDDERDAPAYRAIAASLTALRGKR